jgi:ABC-type Zn2+ transport system substrate-binding protein/surface adhesin
MAQQLCAKWPEATATIRANEKQLLQSLSDLASEMSHLLLPIKGKSAFFDHDSFLYMEQKYHFEVRGVLTEDADVPPTLKHIKALMEELDANLDEKIVQVFFYSGSTTSNPPPLIKKLVTPYKINLTPIDYCAETMVVTKDNCYDIYHQTLRHIATQLRLGFGVDSPAHSHDGSRAKTDTHQVN